MIRHKNLHWPSLCEEAHLQNQQHKQLSHQISPAITSSNTNIITTQRLSAKFHNKFERSKHSPER